MDEKSTERLKELLRAIQEVEREEEEAKHGPKVTLNISIDEKTIELVDRCFRRVICFLEWHHDQVSLAPGEIRAKRSSEVVP